MEALRLSELHSKWKEDLITAELNARYPGDQLQRKVQDIINERRRTDEFFRVFKGPQITKLAHAVLRKEMEAELSLPDLQEWARDQKQGLLF
jgi:hypothetical protein